LGEALYFQEFVVVVKTSIMLTLLWLGPLKEKH
jgi:hypothetical protein